MIEVVGKETKTVCMWEREGWEKYEHDEERNGRYKKILTKILEVKNIM